MSNQLVWYVSYGTNLLRERFMLYIAGGHLIEFARDHRGCPDVTPPRKDISLEVPGELFFASHADHWDGMVAAFMNPAAKDSSTKIRAYLITQDQFEHILAQECNVPDSIRINVKKLKADGRVTVGDGSGFYNQLAYLGEYEQWPLITFTNSGENITLNAPSEAYLEVLVRGLIQAHGMGRSAALQYLMNKKGAENTPS